jgi:hypothetical protein
MRAVSLSNDSVLNALKNGFVCGYKNITGEPYAGRSGHHDPTAPAVLTTNGAGPHNVQMFFLSKDGVVLQCLPGFWAPADFLYEMRFALGLNKLWLNDQVPLETKKRLFSQAQLQDIPRHPADMVARSHLQSFDAQHESKKTKGQSDFIFRPGDYRPPIQSKAMHNLKTTDQVVHERMARRPFVPYDDFDVADFSNYGKERYDKKEETREPGMSQKKKK